MKTINFKNSIENLKETGFLPVPELVHISIPDAKDVLWRGIQYFTGSSAQWLPEYDDVVKWLSGNNGRGLLCAGDFGRGKTIICSKIIPLLLHHYHNKIVSCYDTCQMSTNTSHIRQKHIICMDDIGLSDLNGKYGKRNTYFSEVVDLSEKMGKLLIVTTNLSISELQKEYGERTVDQLLGITIPVSFQGKSLRK